MSGGRWRRFVVAGAVGALAVATGGCQVGLTADVDVRADGSGVVRAGVGLDAEALEAVGDLPMELAVDDLREAGWSVSPPRLEGDGTTWVRATKSFEDTPGASQVLHELGPVFADLRLEREATLRGSRSRLDGALDLTGGLSAFTDPALVEALGPDLLASRPPSVLAGQVRVQFSADLAGRVRSNATVSQRGRPVWFARPGQRIPISATGELDRTALLVAGGGSAALIAGVLVLVVVVRRRRKA